MDYGEAVRAALGERGFLPFVGVYDTFSATLAASRFDTLFLSGFGFAASHYALPDAGFISWTDMVSYVSRIRAVTPSAHLLVDLDDGYGDAEIAAHAAAHVEAVGASGIILEDQQRPRRCGHLGGKQVLELDDYLDKLARVLETRRSLFVVARTDASDPAEMRRRAFAFDETDADAILVDGLKDLGLVRELADSLTKPICFNLIAGGRSPARSSTELRDAGVSIAIHSTPLLFAAQEAVEREVGRLVDSDGMFDDRSEGRVLLADCNRRLDENLSNRHDIEVPL